MKFSRKTKLHHYKWGNYCAFVWFGQTCVQNANKNQSSDGPPLLGVSVIEGRLVRDTFVAEIYRNIGAPNLLRQYTKNHLSTKVYLP